MLVISGARSYLIEEEIVFAVPRLNRLRQLRQHPAGRKSSMIFFGTATAALCVGVSETDGHAL